MAEPLIDPDSPLAHYLQESVPHEFSTLIQSSSSNSVLEQSHQLISNLLQPFQSSHLLLHQIKSISQLILSNLHKLLDSSDRSQIPPTESFDHVQARLSERLKYLICSSFLLNPQLSPAFYDSVTTPPMPSLPDPNSNPNITLNHLRLSSQPSQSFNQKIAGLILIFLLGLLVLPARVSLLLLIGLGSLLFYLGPLNTLTRLSNLSESDPLDFQSQLVPTVAQLVTNSQAMDVRVSRAMGAVKEVECVALGMSISDPMPPVSRLESASFPFASGMTDSPLGSPMAGHLLGSSHPLPPPKLHAIGLRKVVKTVLDQARHTYEQAATDLETVLTSFTSNPNAPPPLDALMEMYGCSRDGFGSSVQSLDATRARTHSDRSRRESWRMSVSSPREVYESADPLVRPNRYSSFPRSPPPRAVSESHSHQTGTRAVGSFEDFKASMIRRNQPRPRLGLALGSPCEGLYANALGFGTPGSPKGWSLSPASPTHSSSAGGQFAVQSDLLPPSPVRSARAEGQDRRISLGWGSSPAGWRGSPSTRPISRTRPMSMGPSSLRRASSYGTYPLHTSQSPIVDDDLTPRADEPISQPAERQPLSLLELQLSFERMHISRKRLLCGLLALDFSCPLAGAAVWARTVEVVSEVVETIERLGADVNTGMSAEFGPGSFENKAVPKAVRQHSASAGEAAEEKRDAHRRSIIDFAPPVPPAEAEQRRVVEVLEQLKIVDCALRTLSAKVSVCVEELGSGSEESKAAAMSLHESMRQDLEKLGREWDESRSKMRRIVEGERLLGQHRLSPRGRPNSADSSESAGMAEQSASGRTSSIFSSELLTPVEEDLSADDGSCSDSAPHVGMTSRPYPPVGLEEVFEAVATRGRAGSMTTGPIKLTREERIRLAREKRESMPAGTRPGPGRKMGDESGGVVTELKDVLSVLKARRLQQISSSAQVPKDHLSTTHAERREYRNSLMY